jgi:hypothetical protein
VSGMSGENKVFTAGSSSAILTNTSNWRCHIVVDIIA